MHMDPPAAQFAHSEKKNDRDAGSGREFVEPSLEHNKNRPIGCQDHCMELAARVA